MNSWLWHDKLRAVMSLGHIAPACTSSNTWHTAIYKRMCPSILMLFIFSFCNPATAQVSSYQELQGAYLYNFAKYIVWPEVDAELFIIGIIEDAEITDHFKEIFKDKKVRGMKIKLKTIHYETELSATHMIYMPDKSSLDISTIKSALQGTSTLIVTEEDLIDKGANISFVMKGKNLRFAINEKALIGLGLTANQGLLNLAIQK